MALKPGDPVLLISCRRKRSVNLKASRTLLLPYDPTVGQIATYLGRHNNMRTVRFKDGAVFHLGGARMLYGEDLALVLATKGL